MFLVVDWLTSNVCRQSFGKAAAAAALYRPTESVSQSVESLCLSVSQLV